MVTRGQATPTRVSRDRVGWDSPALRVGSPWVEDGPTDDALKVQRKASALKGAQDVPGRVQGTSFRGWKDVTSLFNKDDEQHLLERCKSPKSKGTNLRLKEDLKSEKKSGFWDNLVLKQNTQSKKPDEIEGWEPPRVALEDTAPDTRDTASDHQCWSGWEGDTKGSSKYTSLSSPAANSRWSLRSAGKPVSIRRQSKGHLTDTPDDVE
ncbi:testis development-related protein [Octodon degus]|uniref:Testis development-related protein n=1 Tax=Octodon degus TaxID=10160 RepID=A0A6P6DEJ2_OCTDE|nr:testis development-related protein [Octodon degus]